MARHHYLPEVLEEIARLVEASLPEEACGALFGPAGDDVVTRVAPLPNVHPGARRHAFAVDDLAHLALLKDADARGEREKGLFHSHPDGSLELSALDLDGLIEGGAPLFPGVDVVVVSTRGSRAERARVYEIADGEVRVAAEHGLGRRAAAP